MHQRSGVRGFVRDAVVSGVVPWIAVVVMTHFGVRLIAALVLSSLIPLADALVSYVRDRAIDAIGIVNMAFILGSIGLALWSGDVHVVLLKGAVLTGLFGLACLCSLLAPRPLLFYFGRQWQAGHDEAALAAWDARWQYVEFRACMRIMTAVWGAGLGCEVALRVFVAYHYAPMVALGSAPFITYGVLAALIAWTVTYGNAVRRKYEPEGA